MNKIRCYYNIHSLPDHSDPPRSGSRLIPASNAEDALNILYRLRDEQARTNVPAFGEGSYLGMIHAVTI